MEKKIKKRENIEERYNNIVSEYIKLFEEKHDLELDFWISDQIGTVAQFGDYYFDFQDILFDINNDLEEDLIIEWYDYVLENVGKHEYNINLMSYKK